MKVNGRDVIRAIITLVLLGEVVSVVLNYPVWRLLPRFAEATVGGIVLLSILLLPIIWSKSLRRNIALNAVYVHPRGDRRMAGVWQTTYLLCLWSSLVWNRNLVHLRYPASEPKRESPGSE